MIDIIYDSFSMQSDGVTVTTFNGFDAAPKDVQVQNIAGADGGIFIDSKYRPRTIVMEGHLTADTGLELEILIQKFKRAMNKEEKELRFANKSDYSIFTATPSLIAIERTRGLTKATFTIQMTCADPTSYYETSTALLQTTYTTATGNNTINVEGSYKAQPNISMTVTSFTGAGERSITVQNSKNQSGITITREWTAGDEVEIDSESLDVFVNGVQTDFTGLFPEWPPGSGTVSYIDTFTARSVTINIIYNERDI